MGVVSFVGEKGINETRNLPFGAIEWGHLVEINDPDSRLAVSCTIVCDVRAENDLDVPLAFICICANMRPIFTAVLPTSTPSSSARSRVRGKL